MDTETMAQWRWKFYRLALHLNVVVLCIALTVLAGIVAPDPYRIPAVVILIALSIYLGYTFFRNYHATKAWLDAHATPKKQKDPEQNQA